MFGTSLAGRSPRLVSVTAAVAVAVAAAVPPSHGIIGPSNFELGQFSIVVSGTAGAPLVEVTRSATGQHVLGLRDVAIEAGRWKTVFQNEGMLKLDPGAIECQSKSVVVTAATQSPGGGVVSVVGTLAGYTCAHDRSNLSTIPFKLAISIASQSAATVEVDTTLELPTSDPSVISKGAGWTRTVLSVDAAADEKVWGLGVQYSFRDFKGKVVPVVTSEQGIGRGLEPLSLFIGENAGNFHTTYSAIPHYTTSHLRSIYLEGGAVSTFDFTEPSVDRIDVYDTSVSLRFIGAETPLQHVEEYTAYAGRMPILPEWVLSGPIIGYEGGTAAVAALHARVLAAGIKPAAYWLQDWSGLRIDVFGKRLWWNWELDEDHYPMWDELCHNLTATTGTKLMTYINPFLANTVATGKPNAKRNLFKEAAAAGYLIRNSSGDPYILASGSEYFTFGTVDLTNPAAAQWYQDIIRTNMVGRCQAGWMADFSEYVPFNSKLYAGEPSEVHNVFPALWAETNQKATGYSGAPRDPVYFLRASSLRSPSYASLFWLGDQLTSWDEFDGLRTVVNGHISAGLSGLSLMHSDLGGYTMVKEGPVKYLRSRELLVRWMELSAVTDTVFRSHPGNLPNESWQVYSDDSTLRCFGRLAQLHTLLSQYRLDLMQDASQHGHPLVRPMWMHYPQDTFAQTTGTQLLLGEDLMIAPALSKGQSHVEVYIPANSIPFVDVWTGHVYGSTITSTNITLPAIPGKPSLLALDGSKVAALLSAGLASLPENTC